MGRKVPWNKQMIHMCIHRIQCWSVQCHTILQNMHVDFQTVTHNPQVTRKFLKFAKMCCACNTSLQLALRTSVTTSHMTCNVNDVYRRRPWVRWSQVLTVSVVSYRSTASSYCVTSSLGWMLLPTLTVRAAVVWQHRRLLLLIASIKLVSICLSVCLQQQHIAQSITG